VRILLTGRNGQVGWELERALPPLGELIATDRTALDLSDAAAISKVVRNTKPDLIVNAAAYTAVDKAESEPGLAMQVNGVAPGVLAEEARRHGALLVHYSTDYVFDGEKSSPYVESDRANPLNVYGRTKLEGERRIGAAGCRHLILRTSWVYAPRGRNFFLTIAKKVRSGDDLRVVSDQRGVPTEARFVAQTTEALLRGGTEGMFHIVPSGATTWHGFATEIAQRLGAEKMPRAIASSEYPTPARRPRNSVLDYTKLAGRLGARPPEWQSLLHHCVTCWTSADPKSAACAK
jgi:dTDP-4-dehydrorhamnose reductase